MWINSPFGNRELRYFRLQNERILYLSTGLVELSPLIHKVIHKVIHQKLVKLGITCLRHRAGMGESWAISDF